MVRTHKEVLRDALSDPVTREEYHKIAIEFRKKERAVRKSLKKGYTATRGEDALVNNEWDPATMEKWPE